MQFGCLNTGVSIQSSDVYQNVIRHLNRVGTPRAKRMKCHRARGDASMAESSSAKCRQLCHLDPGNKMITTLFYSKEKELPKTKRSGLA